MSLPFPVDQARGPGLGARAPCSGMFEIRVPGRGPGPRAGGLGLDPGPGGPPGGPRGASGGLSGGYYRAKGSSATEDPKHECLHNKLKSPAAEGPNHKCLRNLRKPKAQNTNICVSLSEKVPRRFEPGRRMPKTRPRDALHPAAEGPKHNCLRNLCEEASKMF